MCTPGTRNRVYVASFETAQDFEIASNTFGNQGDVRLQGAVSGR